MNESIKPFEMNDPEEIQKFLSQIQLTGDGFTTECLMADVLDSGLDYPDYLRTDGIDPNAAYEGQSPAWAKYHVRQGKRVFMVYGGEGKKRKTHFTVTP